LSANRKVTLVICIAICAGYFFVGLWPCEFHPRNNLGWRPGASGTFFGWPSIIYSERWFDLGRTAAPPAGAGAVTIELYVASEHRPAREVGSILTLYDGELPENLVIAQWKYDLLLRTPSNDARGRRTFREFGIDAGLYPGTRRFLGLASGPGGTVIYVDGVPAKAFPRLTLHPETLRGRLILGDSPQGNRRWAGKMFGVAIFSRTLTAYEMARHQRLWTGSQPHQLRSEAGLSALYFLDERSGNTVPDRSPARNPLLIPESYQVLSKTFLVSPWEDPHPYFSDTGDVVINVVGFIPFGFFYFIYRDQVGPGRRFRSAALTMTASGIISLAIELIQVYLPTRSSSLTDLICNVGGSFIGLIMALLALTVLRRGIPART
jgi:VanZ family protein